MMKLRNIILKIRPAIIGSLIKKFLLIKRKTINYSGSKFFVDPISNLGNTLMGGMEYEPQVKMAIDSILNDGATFIDIGANEGFFSVFAAKKIGENGKVIIVEPQKRLMDVIDTNMKLNHISNYQYMNIGISNRIGTEKIYISSDTNTGSSGLYRLTKYPLRTEEIEVITLIELIRRVNQNKIDLIKMDIEGHELEVVKGSVELLKKQIVKNFLIEFHSDIITSQGNDPNMLRNLFLENGYKESRHEQTYLFSTEGNTIK